MTRCPFCREAVAPRLDALTEHFVWCAKAPIARGGGFERSIAGIIAANQLRFPSPSQAQEASEVR